MILNDWLINSFWDYVYLWTRKKGGGALAPLLVQGSTVGFYKFESSIIYDSYRNTSPQGLLNRSTSIKDKRSGTSTVVIIIDSPSRTFRLGSMSRTSLRYVLLWQSGLLRSLTGSWRRRSSNLSRAVRHLRLLTLFNIKQAINLHHAHIILNHSKQWKTTEIEWEFLHRILNHLLIPKLIKSLYKVINQNERPMVCLYFLSFCPRSVSYFNILPMAFN